MALGRDPLLKTLLRERELAAPFKKTAASPRGYYLVRSGATPRKPAVDGFAAWLLGQAGSA